jgi:hypothetical protein
MPAVAVVRRPPPRTAIVAAPRPRTRVVVAQAAGRIARRAGAAAAYAAREEKHTIAAVVAAGAIGYAQREGMLDNIPHIQAIGPIGTLGGVAWALGRFMRSRVASHVATGLLSVAVFKAASES